ncbi:MAG: hypothetical protein GY861_18305 [bacterium]|nr:hypothetical protein [bacterium]
MANDIEALKPKRKKEVAPEVEETTPEVEVATDDSEARKAQKAIYAKYKKQNPVKYEQKREAFEKKLANL